MSAARICTSPTGSFATNGFHIGDCDFVAERVRLRPSPDQLSIDQVRTDTLDLGVASLREHRAYLDGLDDDAVDPDQLLRGSARAAGESVRCAYAVTFQRFPA